MLKMKLRNEYINTSTKDINTN